MLEMRWGNSAWLSHVKFNIIFTCHIWHMVLNTKWHTLLSETHREVNVATSLAMRVHCQPSQFYLSHVIQCYHLAQLLKCWFRSLCPYQCLASMAGSTKSFLLPPPKWKTWTEVSLLTSRSGRGHSGTCVHVCTHSLSFTLFCSFKCNNNKSQNTKFKSNLFTTKLSIWALCHKLYPRTSYSVVEQSMSPMQVNCKGVSTLKVDKQLL